ncbi:MAG TPA: hypothetical protein VGM16_03660 [Gammaproteobacteria bacterium]|jgi:hypothetical protein
MKLRTLLFGALLALAGVASAATPSPATSTGAAPMEHREGPCKANPAQCRIDAAKFDQWCSANAEKCTDLKAWAEKRREYCEAHGQECKEHMQKMHEHMQEWCSKHADDEHCQKMKERHATQADEPGANGEQPGDGQMPPPPPSA